jgi:HAE1 family hydrophobic/amphiphilic exporter-1
MNISGPFIRRPVATALVMVAILLFGVFGYRALPVSDLPNVDLPTLVVTANLPGASPETMASAVATPLERQFSTIAGLTAMNSINVLGGTQVTLQFDLSRDLDGAAQDVQAAITLATPLLPPSLPTPPVYRKVNPADQPILFLVLTSATLPLYELDEYGQTLMAQRISMVPGVAQVQVFGSQKYAVRVQVDPSALASRGIAMDEVARAVQTANVNLPTGVLYGRDQAFTVESSGQLLRAPAYRSVIVAYRNGSPVRVEDVAQVIDGVEDDKVASWFATRERVQRSLILAVQRQPGTNTVAVADAVKALLPTFKAWLPPAVQVEVLFDRSQSIRESVAEVRTALLEAFVLVVLVIFLFLRNLSATIIPSLALPISIIGTFAVMQPLGFSLDNLSLLALTLCIGFVVDDAIVILENIVRHMEMGKRPLQAALDGAQEIGFTILSMTLSLAAVFIPVFFLPGILGRLFHEFSVTICVAILISGVVSLTLTPMLCARYLRPPGAERHGRLYMATERFFDAMQRAYERSLRWVLRHRPATMAVSLLLLGLTVVLFERIPKGFIPNDDQGLVFTVVEAAEGVSFEQMTRLQLAVTDVIRADPAVEKLSSSISASNGGNGATLNQGRLFLRLKPRGERPSATEVIARLRPKVNVIPGVRVYMQVPPIIRLGGQLTKSLYQFTLQSPSTDELYRAAPQLEAALRKLPALQDVTSDLQIKNPQVTVSIDRDQASILGVTAEQVEQTLYDSFGARWVTTIYAPNNQYRVILEVADRFQSDPAALSQLYVRSDTGRLVPLGAVATLAQGYGPLTVNHFGQLPAVTLSFNLAPGYALSDAVTAVDATARRVLPATVTSSFQGQAQAFTASMSGLWALLLLAVLVIYLVLGILYESFVHPLTILSGLPSAGFGALATLWLFGFPLDIYGFVGLILLIGIVKKNAIMQIDFALSAQRTEGKPPLEAIYEGCLIRFRPIMMTTMAALLGALPIALGAGAGAESRRPLGLAVVGGLLFSQLITLYLTPVYYAYLEALTARFGRRRQPDVPEPPAPAVAVAASRWSAGQRGH